MNLDSTFFQAILEHIADGVVVCDANGILTYFNRALEKAHGLGLQPLPSEDWASHYNLYYPDGSGVMRRDDVPLYKALKGERVINNEILVKQPNGESILMYASGNQVRDTAGNILGAVVSMHDITEIQQAHDRLDELNHFANKIANLTPGLITVFDVNTGRYRYVNKAMETMLGYTPGEIMEGGLDLLLSFVHPDDTARIIEENRKAILSANETGDYNDNDPVEFEYRMRHKNGNYIWVHTYAVVFSRDAEKKIQDAINITVDITERKNAELDLVQSKIKEDYFRDVADQSPFMIWKVDVNALCTYVNKPWCDFTGLSIEESLNIGWQKGFHPDDALPEYEKFKKCFAARIPYHSKFRLRRKDGTYRWVLAQSNPLQQEGKGYIGSLTDITEQEAARQGLESLMREKDEFISLASHELKTPVTTLKAFTQVLQMQMEQDVSPGVGEMLLQMDKQINKLTRLISDLLEAVKATSGEIYMQYEQTPFDFSELVKEMAAEIQHSSPSHTIQLKLSETKTVLGDRNRVGQVISNLITNAIKYSPEADHIILSTSSAPGEIECCVQDFGIGIPQSEQPKLFTRFFRVCKDGTQTFPGLGLGLYICKEIISRHSGRIDFKSEEGKGSTFCFTLPTV